MVKKIITIWLSNKIHAEEDRWTSEFQRALNSQNGWHIRRYARRRNGRLIKRVLGKTKSMAYTWQRHGFGKFPVTGNEIAELSVLVAASTVELFHDRGEKSSGAHISFEGEARKSSVDYLSPREFLRK